MSKRSCGGGTGPLALHAPGFRAEPTRLGYSKWTVKQHLRLLAGLSRWLEDAGLDVGAVEHFFAARRDAGCVNLRTSGSVAPLLSYLRHVGACRGITAGGNRAGGTIVGEVSPVSARRAGPGRWHGQVLPARGPGSCWWSRAPLRTRAAGLTTCAARPAPRPAARPSGRRREPLHSAAAAARCSTVAG